MSADATMAGPGDRSPSPGEFITDGFGRRLFYPFGFSYSGYVVPDAACERKLRGVIERFRNGSRRLRLWPLVVILPCLVAATIMLDIHPFWSLAGLVAPVLLAIAVPRALLSYRIGPIVDGLQQVRRRDNMPAYIRQMLLAALALALVTQQVYDSRLSTLPSVSGTVVYYPDIAKALVLALLFGCFALLLATARNNPKTRFNGSKADIALVIFALFTVCFIAYAANNFINPAPSVTVSSEGLFCGWRVRWSDISNLSESSSARRGYYAVLKIGSDPNLSIWSAGNVQRCQINGLNEDYDTVYHTIRTAWLASRQPPAAATSDAASSDRIAIGTSRPQVVGVYGLPKLSTRTPDGSIALYYSAADTSNLAAAIGPVLAVYFDTNDQVERVARYSVRDGKIFDSMSNKPLSSGYEYPLLFTILIDKAHDH